jgi:hypothetical protein
MTDKLHCTAKSLYALCCFFLIFEASSAFAQQNAKKDPGAGTEELDAVQQFKPDISVGTSSCLSVPKVKHIAASNYFIWSGLTGDKLPVNLKDGNGPVDVKTKAGLMFLKDSFALGHRAAATLTTENMLQTPDHSKSTRLHLATFGVAHAFNHYGQMVEYLRMNGIVPPASRGKSD